MADVKIPKAPKSIPCKFDAGGWAPCKKPSDNGWCSKHEKAKCSSCGKHAVKSCDAQMGGLGCGVYLCATCEHYDGVHVTQKVANERRELEEEGLEEPSALQKRGVPTDLNLPRHLKELLAGDHSAYKIQVVYSLMLVHGLMGYFPAIFTGSKRIVLTTDVGIIKSVWRMLEPRESKLITTMYHLNDEIGIGYPVLGDSEYDKEISRPQRILTPQEFEKVCHGKNVFRWAFGLMGGRNFSPEEMERIISTASA